MYNNDDDDESLSQSVSLARALSLRRDERIKVIWRHSSGLL